MTKSALLANRPLLYPASMAAVDARTIKRGVSGQILMERAGAAIVRILRSRWAPCSVLILAGPGNNGGDGWVIARLLKESGWQVSVASNWTENDLIGDAKSAAHAAGITPLPLSEADFLGSTLIVDALFGAGLSRPLDGEIATCLRKARECGASVLAVDLPSGLCGRTGKVLGAALRADATVSFGTAKPGHLLGEGREMSGELFVVDIGLDLLVEDADAFWNCPDLWQAELPLPPKAAHKYARGCVLVVGGGRHQGGAARLAAHAAAVTGAGAVTIVVTPQAADIYSGSLDAIMVRTIRGNTELVDFAADPKIRAVVIGPGLGVDKMTLEFLEAVIAAGKPMLLDADALTLLSTRKEGFDGLPEGCIFTPHEGEFARLFPDLLGSALDRAVAAAERSGQTILLKGAATIIAQKDKIPIINTHATPWLATAGAGDVLCGIIAALMAQGVSSHISAAAGAWIHGDAGQRTASGLTADNLWPNIASVLHAIGGITDN